MKRIKQIEKKLRHNCPSCLSTYTLLETHLTKKDLTKCPTNCQKTWQNILNKHCQEKVLGAELEDNQEEQNLKEFLKDKNHGSK